MQSGRRKLVSKRPAERGSEQSSQQQQQPSAVTAPDSAAAVQRATNRDYHFSVRKCIRQTLEDANFTAAATSLKSEFGTPSEGDVVTLEALLNPICVACDAACEQHPFSAPIQVPYLSDHVKSAVEEAIVQRLKLQPQSASPAQQQALQRTGDVFTETFVSKVLQFLNKIDVPVPTVPPSRSSPPPQPISTSPTLPPYGAQPGAPPPPPLPAGERPRKFARTEGALLQQPNSTGTNDESDTGSLLAAPKYQPLPSSVLPTPPKPQPLHPKCQTRCVTLDNVPAHLCMKDALRPHLNNICSWNQEKFYLNTDVIIPAPSEDSILQAGKVVVSLSTTEAADDLIQRINFQSFVDQSPIIARESTADEREVLWGPKRRMIESLQEQTLTALQQFEETNPRAIRSFRLEALEELKKIDVQLAQEALPDTERLQLMRTKFEAVQAINTAVKSLTDMREPVEGPAESFSSSSATITNNSALLFIGSLPAEGLSDSRLLLLLKPFTETVEGLWIQLVHVWRDPQSATRVCCALQSIGQVFAVLRALDATDFQFCGATFSRSRPA